MKVLWPGGTVFILQINRNFKVCKLSAALSALPLRLLQGLSRIHVKELGPVIGELTLLRIGDTGHMLPHIIPHTVGVIHIGPCKGTEKHSQGKLEEVLIIKPSLWYHDIQINVDTLPSWLAELQYCLWGWDMDSDQAAGGWTGPQQRWWGCPQAQGRISPAQTDHQPPICFSAQSNFPGLQF